MSPAGTGQLVSTARWSSTLDTFAEHLAQQRTLLASGNAELFVAFAPEPGLGALPLALLPRARELQGEADALTAMVQDQMSRTLAAIARLRQPAERAPAAYVDSRC